MAAITPNVNWLEENDGKTVVLSFRHKSFAVTVQSIDDGEIPIEEVES